MDEAHLGASVVPTIHRIDRIEGKRIRINYAVEITGPEADTVGPQVGLGSAPTFRSYAAVSYDRLKNSSSSKPMTDQS